MSFSELITAVESLSPAEKLQLVEFLTCKISSRVPSDYIIPGSVIFAGSQITTDESGLKMFFEADRTNIEE